jgi:hypothetical protein
MYVLENSQKPGGPKLFIIYLSIYYVTANSVPSKDRIISE